MELPHSYLRNARRKKGSRDITGVRATGLARRGCSYVVVRYIPVTSRCVNWGLRLEIWPVATSPPNLKWVRQDLINMGVEQSLRRRADGYGV